MPQKPIVGVRRYGFSGFISSLNHHTHHHHCLLFARHNGRIKTTVSLGPNSMVTYTIPRYFTRNLSFSRFLESKQFPVPGEPLSRLVKVIPGNFLNNCPSAASPTSIGGSDKMNLAALSFQQQLPVILENIRRSMFVAVDLEFSGIVWTPKKNQTPTVQDRYSDMRKSATTFQVLQLGICPVEWNEKKACYVARPTNIYVNPIIGNREFCVNRNITLAVDAVDFLIRNGFDFNALFENGVPYLSHEEEKSIVLRRQQRATSEELTLDDQNVGFVGEINEACKSWVDDKDSPFDFLNITAETGLLNSYQRRLIHIVVEKNFPTLHSFKKGNYVQVIKNSPEQKNPEKKSAVSELQEQINAAIGVRHIIDELFSPKRADGKKIVLIGHNLIMDLLFIYQTFIGPLPYSAVEFASIIHKAFPTVIDTKYLATLTDTVGGSGSTLANVWAMLKDQQNPQIELDSGYAEYENSVANHEAGYDAYNCARILVKLAARMSSHYLLPGRRETAWTSPNNGLTNFITAITQGENFKDDVYFMPGFQDDGEAANKFWNTLSNKLRMFGTVEGLFKLEPDS